MAMSFFLSISNWRRDFNMSVRTISRAVHGLVKAGIIHKTRRKRHIDGQFRPNIVGVLPSSTVIDGLSKFGNADKMAESARRQDATAIPRLAVPNQKQLIDFHATIREAFRDAFDWVVDLHYNRQGQENVDRVAIEALPFAEQGVEGIYRGLAARYLNGLAKQAQKRRVRIQEAASENYSYARPPFTIEQFVAWATKDGTLPGSAKQPKT